MSDKTAGWFWDRLPGGVPLVVVTTGTVEFVDGAVVEVVTAAATGQNINTQRRRKQETPPRDRENIDNPLHVC